MLEMLAVLERSFTRLGELFQPSKASSESLVREVSKLLLQCCPGGVLYACQLGLGKEAQFSVLDKEGNPQATRLPEDTDLVRGWTQTTREQGEGIFVPLEGKPGLLGVVLSPEAAEESKQRTRLGLSCLGRHLSAQLGMLRLGELQDDQEALEHQASIGEISGVLAHEFMDFLNMLLLQVTVLEYRLPPSERTDLGEIRRQGTRASELVSQFQQYRKAGGAVPAPVDLHGAIAEVISQLAREGHGAAVQYKAGAKVAQVRGPGVDLRRLLRFLIGNASRASASMGKEVEVRTEEGESGPRLIIEDHGPPVAESDLPYLLNATYPARERTNALELAACRSLARRVGGTLLVEKARRGAVRYQIEFEYPRR